MGCLWNMNACMHAGVHTSSRSVAHCAGLCWCGAVCLQTVNEDGTWKQLEPEQQQQLDDMQRAFLENIRKSGE